MRRGIRKGGGWVKLRGVMTIRKPSGATYTYFRAPGKLIRLPDLPHDHPDFLAAWSAARDATPTKRSRAAADTISAAIEAHLASDRHLCLAASTRNQRRRIFDHIRADVGQAMLGDLRARHVRSDLSGRTPSSARNRLKCWRALTSWALEAGLINDDPAAGVRPPKAPASAGHSPWEQTDIDQFRAHWPTATPQRLAFELLHWTGARISDAVRLGPGMVDGDGWLTYRQTKTGGQVSIPWLRTLPPWLQAAQKDLDQLHATIEAQPGRAMTWMLTEHGTARSIKAASAWFSAAARAAGVHGKSAHGLRKTRASILAEAGASTHQIAAWTGHESLSEVQHYARSADRKRLLSGPDQEQKLQTKSHSLQKLQ